MSVDGVVRIPLERLEDERGWFVELRRDSALPRPTVQTNLSYPRKGVIQAGAEADIAVVDLARTWTIDDAKLQSRSKVTPWHGRAVKGLPLHTLVRGRFIMRDRTLVSQTRGWGRSVHAIQQMPDPQPRNADKTMQAIVQHPASRHAKEYAA